MVLSLIRHANTVVLLSILHQTYCCCKHNKEIHQLVLFVLHVNFSSPIGATGKVPPIYLSGKHSSHSKYSSHSGPSSFPAFRSFRLSSFPHHFCFPVVAAIPVIPGNQYNVNIIGAANSLQLRKFLISAVPTVN
jgi:hypothetical protein